MSSTRGKLLTGPRAKFALEGKVVGYATNVQLGESIEYEPTRVLGNIRVNEHVAIAYDVTFSVGTFRIIGNSLKAAGYFPKNGQSPAEHLRNILTSGDLTATVEDQHTGTLIATVEEVKIASQSYSIDARSVAGNDVQFVAVLLSDEGDSLPTT